ncbi:MAG: NAD(P)H-dependent flavin oxidoreductase [Leucobacter sp.]
MGGVAGGRLASAVSRAGALGMIGMGSAASPRALRRELGLLDVGGAPFGVGFAAWGLAREPEMLDIALAARPALVSVSFADWEVPEQLAWVGPVRAGGAIAVMQVATADEAKRAADLGVEAVIARGAEGGGHGDHQRPRDELLAEVLAVVQLPVLSAGAVSTGDELRAVLDAGAAAAWVGTAFAACEEALTSDAAREVLLAADGSETTVSRVLDVGLERPWPKRFSERLLRTPFVERWQGREDQLAADAEARAELRAAVEADDFSVVPLDAGEGVGALTRVRSAAEVVEEFAANLR